MKKWIGLLIVVCGLLSSPLAADEWVEMDAKQNVSLDKSWEITFDKPVKRGTIHSKSVYAVDSNGNQLFLATYLSDDRETVNVLPPADFYTPGERYELFVEMTIESEEGKTLAEGYRLPFSIDPTDTKPNPLPSYEGADFIGEVTVDSRLRVRSEPSTESDDTVIGHVYNGDQLPIYDIDGFWVETEIEVDDEMKTAYLHKDYLKLYHASGQLLKDIRIVIDAGHGGSDNGASVYEPETIREKNINLPVAKKVRDNLEKLGANVYLTREDDTYISLDERVVLARNFYNDLFVSIHANAMSDEKIHGAETFYSRTKSGNSTHSLYLADGLQNQLTSLAEMRHRRVDSAKFRVIHDNPSTASLVELGFMTNQDDLSRLLDDDYQQLFADAITQGIINYYQ
ncbi:N-acetylmuramoyl-L-alanine amidase [Alkalibacillus flavidus]|uniref:N-acetylmuramoyl-L-alanine amidase n=1 Tax=Alkalibacillus flavidus TaxID=546021 RepID=A0ABV2KWE4_9BACI